MSYIHHYLGEYDTQSKTQLCIHCGKIIHDYSTEPSGTGNSIKGWPMGNCYIKESNPTFYTTEVPKGTIVITCNDKYIQEKINQLDGKSLGDQSGKITAIIAVVDFSQYDGELNIKHIKSNNKTMNKMQVAIGVKMIAFKAMTLGEYNNYRGWNQPIGEDPKAEGYLIEYLGQGNKNHANHDNYISWSPKDVHEASYYSIDDQTKISRADVEGFIVKGEPTKLGEKTTIVLDTTITGFDTVATSACVDPNNFDLQIGADIARKDITDKIWGHLGFVLQWAKNGLKAKANS